MSMIDLYAVCAAGITTGAVVVIYMAIMSSWGWPW
jgi:hypothetical protein